MVTRLFTKPVGCHGKPTGRLGGKTHGPARAWQHLGFLVDPVQVKLDPFIRLPVQLDPISLNDTDGTLTQYLPLFN